MPECQTLGGTVTSRILLTSVFGPYARDDEFGSRRINPMELYHNQVTRLQGPFSLRMFHRSWGLMMIQANLENPSTLLDFPTQERFVEELRAHRYDLVGISAIVANVGKVRRMCELVRLHSPHSTIVVGGHVAGLADLGDRIDADHVVAGEGVRWMRRHLGQDPHAPLRHPDIVSAFGNQVLGLKLPERPGAVAATVIPSVGCPVGCNFCATSSFFGGKGRFVNLFPRGAELFEIMEGLEERLGVQSFFVLDENFLLHRRRALQLLEAMEERDKAWSLYVFSSAHALSRYSMEELVRLGVSWVWMGLEGEDGDYRKLKGIDTLALVKELQAHGIRVLGSTIIGLEGHTTENIDRVIERAVRHGTDFHQFMLYTPLPGTPLWEEHRRRGTILEDVDPADIHGQYRFNFRHPHISPEESERFLLRAFRRDMGANGPSLCRTARTLLKGWRRYRDHPQERVRRRLHRECGVLRWAGSGVLWAARRYLKGPGARALEPLRRELGREFGLGSRLAGPLLGCLMLASMWCLGRRLERGYAPEPRTFVERRNWS